VTRAERGASWAACSGLRPSETARRRSVWRSRIVLRYNLKRKAELTDEALAALADMKRVDRRFVLEGINTHLIENDPAEATRNKFPLKRPSEHAERELRLENWRVFYSVRNQGEDQLVLIHLIGEKLGNKLFIGGVEFEL